MKVAIIGAGLAGTSLAYVLAQNGVEAEIYEAGDHVASGASGNNLGLINPRISAHRTAESDFFSAAFALGVRSFRQMSAAGADIEWNEAGALHLIMNEKRDKQCRQTVDNWGWAQESMRRVRAAEASDIAGIDIAHECLYLPEAGSVSPQKLCAFYARGITVHLNHAISNLSDIEADVIILACGAGALKFSEAAWLPLSTVRGQVSNIHATPLTQNLKAHLCYSGHLSAPLHGQHMVGSTFQRWLETCDAVDEDDQENLDKLCEAIPALAQEQFEVRSHRAGLRTASKDYFPVTGKLPQEVSEHNNIYVSTAHGSYGIISSLMSAHLLTDMILDRPHCLPNPIIKALSPRRFYDRD